MTDEQKAIQDAAAAGPQSIVVGGRTFIVPVPTLADFFAQRSEARRQVQSASTDPLDLLNQRISAAERANKPYSPTLIAALTDSAMKSATSKEARTEPTDSQLAEQVIRPEMVYWWAWHMIRKADPTVTLDQVKEWAPGDAVYELSGKLGELMKLVKLNPN